MSIRLGIRYASYLINALVAGFTVVVTQSFAPSTVAWIAFGAAVFFTLGAAVRLLEPGIMHRLLQGGVGVLGILMVIETLLAGGSTVVWLSFAGALGVLALSLIGLTIHELSTERVVHSLEVSGAGTDVRQPALS